MFPPQVPQPSDGENGCPAFQSPVFTTLFGRLLLTRIIGYQYVNLGKMMDLIEEGISAQEALSQSTSTYGRYNEAVQTINPRKQ